MNKRVVINHHTSVVLPYYIDKNNKVYLVLEQKDKSYNPPYFNNGLCLFGGCWQKGVNKDKSPEEILDREISEEFWIINEEDESLNKLLGEKFLKNEPSGEPDAQENVKKNARIIGKILKKDAERIADFFVKISPPLKKNLMYNSISIFMKKLSKEEFDTIKKVLQELNNKVTTDNFRWDSRTVIISFDEIHKQEKKFVWAYNHIINEFIDSGILPDKGFRFKTFHAIEIEKMNFSMKNPGFSDYEKLGYKFLEWS